MNSPHRFLSANGEPIRCHTVHVHSIIPKLEGLGMRPVHVNKGHSTVLVYVATIISSRQVDIIYAIRYKLARAIKQVQDEVKQAWPL